MSITVMKQIKQCLQDKMYAHAEMYLSQAIAEAEKQEPMKLPLPCDITVGHVTIRKGVALSVLVARMQVLYDMAQASPPQRQWVGLTQEDLDHYREQRWWSAVDMAKEVEAKLKEKNT